MTTTYLCGFIPDHDDLWKPRYRLRLGTVSQGGFAEVYATHRNTSVISIVLGSSGWKYYQWTIDLGISRGAWAIYCWRSTEMPCAVDYGRRLA